MALLTEPDMTMDLIRSEGGTVFRPGIYAPEPHCWLLDVGCCSSARGGNQGLAELAPLPIHLGFMLTKSSAELCDDRLIIRHAPIRTSCPAVGPSTRSLVAHCSESGARLPPLRTTSGVCV